jgi:hypothetical protein
MCTGALLRAASAGPRRVNMCAGRLLAIIKPTILSEPATTAIAAARITTCVLIRIHAPGRCDARSVAGP